MPDKAIITYNVVKMCKTLDLPIPSKSQTLGRLGELWGYKYFHDLGSRVAWQCEDRQYADYDLKVDGEMVEVKASLKNKDDRFTFVLIKNRYPNGTIIADKVLFVFLDNLDSRPTYLLLSREEIPPLTGLGGKLGYFAKKFPGKIS